MKAVIPALAALCLASSLVAQQAARQGTEADRPADPNAFHSPMVLETVFGPADQSQWQPGTSSGWHTLREWWELGKFSCDGVFLRADPDRKHQWDSGIQMRTKDLPDGTTRFEYEFGVLNPKHNRDKMVALRIEVVSGEEVIVKSDLVIKAKDNGEGQQDSVKWTLSKRAIQPTTKLRITMTTKDY